MLKSKTLLTEDLFTVDWSKFNCRAVLNELTGHLQIVCDIKPEHSHMVVPKDKDPSKHTSEWDEWIEHWFRLNRFSP